MLLLHAFNIRLGQQRPAGPPCDSRQPRSRSEVALKAESPPLPRHAKLEQASGWCLEQGVESIAELKEADMVGDMAKSLGLKPAKNKLLLKRVAEMK